MREIRHKKLQTVLQHDLERAKLWGQKSEQCLPWVGGGGRGETAKQTEETF